MAKKTTHAFDAQYSLSELHLPFFVNNTSRPKNPKRKPAFPCTLLFFWRRVPEFPKAVAAEKKIVVKQKNAVKYFYAISSTKVIRFLSGEAAVGERRSGERKKNLLSIL